LPAHDEVRQAAVALADVEPASRERAAGQPPPPFPVILHVFERRYCSVRDVFMMGNTKNQDSAIELVGGSADLQYSARCMILVA
jgi:hypothetical protein